MPGTTLKPRMMVDPPHPFAKRGIDGILIEIAGPLPRAKQGTFEALHSRLTTTFARVATSLRWRMDGNSGKHVQNATNWGQVPPGLQPSVYGSRIGRSFNVILGRVRGDSSGFTREFAFTAE